MVDVSEQVWTGLDFVRVTYELAKRWAAKKASEGKRPMDWYLEFREAAKSSNRVEAMLAVIGRTVSEVGAPPQGLKEVEKFLRWLERSRGPRAIEDLIYSLPYLCSYYQAAEGGG